MSVFARSNKRRRLDDNNEAGCILCRNSEDFALLARGGDFRGRDKYLEFLRDESRATDKLKHAVRTGEQDHISDLGCAVSVVGSELARTKAFIDEMTRSYNQAKANHDKIVDLQYQAKAVVSDTYNPLVDNPSKERAANIMESLKPELHEDYAAQLVRARTGFLRLENIKQVPQKAVLLEVLKCLKNSSYKSHKNFVGIMSKWATMRMFHRVDFPINSIIAWPGYGRQTIEWVLALYLDVEDLDNHIESHLRKGERFELAEGRDVSPWSFPKPNTPARQPLTPMRQYVIPNINPRLTLQAVSPRRTSAALRVYAAAEGNSLLDVLHEAAAYCEPNVDDDDMAEHSQLQLPNVDGDDENEELNVKPQPKQVDGYNDNCRTMDI